MYEITINDTVYQFNFGMGFLRELNKLVKNPVDGMRVEQNIGFRYYLADMLDGNPEALSTVLITANKGQSPRVTQKLIDEFIDDPDTDIDAVFDEVFDFFGKSNSTKTAYNRLMQAIRPPEA